MDFKLLTHHLNIPKSYLNLPNNIYIWIPFFLFASASSPLCQGLNILDGTISCSKVSHTLLPSVS